MTEAPKRLWISFADLGDFQPLHIRQWQSTPFAEGTEYLSTPIAAGGGEAEALQWCVDVCDHALEHYKGAVARKIRREIAVELQRRASLARKTTGAATKPPRCPHCGAGAIGNCGAYGAEVPRAMCPHKPSPPSDTSEKRS